MSYFYDYDDFGEPYFEGEISSSPNIAGYSTYDSEMFPTGWYAKFIHDRLVEVGIDPSDSKLLVAGCAYGHTVDHLVEDWGIDAYGIDVSTYAVDIGSQSIANTGRIYQGDILSETEVRSVRKDTPGGKFDVVYNECTLCCFTDSSSETAAGNLRSEAKKLLIHRVWSTDGSDIVDYLYNPKTLSEWKSLCDPDGSDLWFTYKEMLPGSGV